MMRRFYNNIDDSICNNGGIWCYIPAVPDYSMNKSIAVSLYIVNQDNGYADIPGDDIAVEFVKAIDLSTGNELDNLYYDIKYVVEGNTSTSSMNIKARIFIENGMMSEGQVFLVTAQIYCKARSEPIKKTVNSLFVATRYSYNVVPYIINALKDNNISVIPNLQEIPKLALSSGSYIYPVVVI